MSKGKDGLTDKQRMFCKEYLKDLNATQAAIRAGYSENTAKEIGCQNLTKVNVQEYVQSLMEKRSEKVEINADDVLRVIKETMELSVAEKDKANAYKGAELLGKHLKLFTDKLDLGGQSDNPIAITVTRKIVDPNEED